MTDSLAPDRVAPLLRGRFGSPYVYRERCGSTQELLGAGLPEGAVAVCEHQSGGRGRLGRRWEAPRGEAVLCSLLLCPPAGRRLPELSLVAGVAVARTIEEKTTRRAQVKWPNDVLVGDAKVAGILAEARGGDVALGIGVNVNQTPGGLPQSHRRAAASLRSLDGRRRERAPVLAALLLELELAYDAWLEGGLAPLLPELAERDWLRGRQVAVGDLRGIASGIGLDGRLELDAGGARHAVSSGEVSVEG